MANFKMQKNKHDSKQSSNLNSLLSNLINENSEEKKTNQEDKAKNPYGWVDIIEFCSSPYYLNLTLYPWQSLILKLFYMGSMGNQNLSINSKTGSCRNCIWFKNNANIHSPCLKCSQADVFETEKILQELENNFMLTEEEVNELRHVEKVDNFMNELQLMERDLIDSSDSAKGGSVKKQIFDKIGKSFSELLLVLGRRSGKALHKDTPIPTPNGWTTMEHIQPGDYVFDEYGQQSLVLGATDIMYDRPCYEVLFSNGEKIIADKEHTWRTLTKLERKYAAREKRELVPKETSTVEIMNTLKYGSKQESNHAIQICKPLDYDEKNLPIDPYVLGAWLGDGCKTNCFITTYDEEIIDNIAECGYKMLKTASCSNRWTISEYLKTGECFRTTARKENIWRNKHIPRKYLEASIPQRFELLKGLMDTDGYIKENGTCEFTNTNKILAEQFLELATGLGLKATLREGNAILNKKIISKKYRICFTPPVGINVFKLKRKLDRQKEWHKSDIDKVFIKSVKKVDSMPVKCIEVQSINNTYLCGKSCIPTHNSMLVSIIALYESYKLIEMGNPQARFGNLNEGDTICILNVAVSELQAKESVFDKIKPMITNSPYFKDKISPGSVQNRSVRFLTPRDKEINERLVNEGLSPREGSIYLLSGHSNSDSLVGKNVIVVIIDEMASMVGKDGSKMSDEELYTKLKHSIWTFGRNGKIMCISNPLTKDGKFYELYEQSFTDPRILMVQLPSYKVNPTLDEKALDDERRAAREAGQYENYLMQIEAHFSGGAAEPFIPSDFIDAAFEKGSHRRRAERGNPNLLYYMHLDPANNSDNYALAVVHVEDNTIILDDSGKPTKTVIVDHINLWQPSETGEPVNIAEVDEYVINMSRRFNLVSITYDMWESASSSQLLQRMGLPARITPFSSSYKQSIYSSLRNLFYKGNIEFYGMDGYDQFNNSDTYGYVLEAADQFKFLERKFNTHSFSVHAADSHFDDIPDCIAGASYIALTNQQNQISLPRMGTVKIHGGNSKFK